MDDLTRRLGQIIGERPRRSAKLLLALFTGALCLPLATFAGWAMFAPDQLGGEPMARASIESAIGPSAANVQTPVIKVISADQQTSVADRRTAITIIERQQRAASGCDGAKFHRRFRCRVAAQEKFNTALEPLN